MKPHSKSPRSGGYSLLEVLVAMSIIALAIGAAARLSLSQNLTEEVNQRKAFAVNYAENAARLWQLGIDNPSAYLLHCKDTDGTPMILRIDSNMATAAVDAPVALNAGDDGSGYAITSQRSILRVTWLPPGSSTTSSLDFPVVRQIPPHR